MLQYPLTPKATNKQITQHKITKPDTNVFRIGIIISFICGFTRKKFFFLFPKYYSMSSVLATAFFVKQLMPML